MDGAKHDRSTWAEMGGAVLLQETQNSRGAISHFCGYLTVKPFIDFYALILWLRALHDCKDENRVYCYVKP